MLRQNMPGLPGVEKNVEKWVPNIDPFSLARSFRYGIMINLSVCCAKWWSIPGWDAGLCMDRATTAVLESSGPLTVKNVANNPSPRVAPCTSRSCWSNRSPNLPWAPSGNNQHSTNSAAQPWHEIWGSMVWICWSRAMPIISWCIGLLMLVGIAEGDGHGMIDVDGLWQRHHKMNVAHVRARTDFRFVFLLVFWIIYHWPWPCEDML